MGHRPSTLENAGVNIGSIQRTHGHENRITTEIYLHSIRNPERVAMNVYEKVTGDKVPHRRDDKKRRSP